MSVDALTPQEIAALGVNVAAVPGVGPNAFVGMTPNELKEALDRRGVGYDRAALGQMQQEYASLFGSGSKGKGGKKGADEDVKVVTDEEEEDSLVGGTGGKTTGGLFTDVFGGAPPGKGATVSFGNTGVDVSKVGTGTTNFSNVDLFAGRAPPAAPPADLPSLPATPSVVPDLPAFGGGGMSEADRIDQEHNSPAGAPGSQHSSPNEIGGMLAAGANPAAGHDMLATGDTGGSAPGGYVNRGGYDKGSTPGQEAGQGGQGGQGHGGANGVGNGNDAGSGTAGAGQSGEGGQWMVGTAHTGDDGDEIMDEPVDGQVHENEAVLPEDMRNDIGEDVLAEAIALYQDDGLTPRERLMALKDLLGEWANS